MTRTPSSELPATIVAAAERLLAGGGPRAVTLRAVAVEADVSPQSVANRFRTIDELLDDLAIRGYRRLAERLIGVDDRPLATFDDPIELITEAVRRYWRFSKTDPHLHRLMMRPSLTPRVRSEARETLSVISGATRRGLASGSLADGDPERIARQLVAITLGTIVLEDAGLAGSADGDGVQTAVAMLLQGLRSERGG